MHRSEYVAILHRFIETRSSYESGYVCASIAASSGCMLQMVWQCYRWVVIVPWVRAACLHM
jgi:hypothetical protein